MTDRSPTVSVVMPSLNHARYLGPAVCSVLAQAQHDVELIVMDGGSDDGTLSLLTDLAAHHRGRLRWWSGPDGGPADAVNAAVQRARAPLIGWLNSDDLYAPGAIGHALDHMRRHPGHVMVYGQGEHVDGNGTLTARYPTQPPSAPLSAFTGGCFICQPTAFFRRDAFLALGGLDNTLRTAFDFDLWLRMFKAYPGRIGFIDAELAQSRLHEGSITLRFRERVAMEGLQVLRRHLGRAPGQWLATHLDELCALHPFHAEQKDLRAEFARIVAQAREFLDPTEADLLLRRAEDDRRLQLATPDCYVAVHPDGWAGELLEVRFRQPASPLQSLRLVCVNATPGGARLQLTSTSPDGTERTTAVGANGPFELVLDLPDQRPGARMVFRIASSSAFVPAQVEPGSADTRRLAYRIEAVAPSEASSFP
jgi:hypothetical protein